MRSVALCLLFLAAAALASPASRITMSTSEQTPASFAAIKQLQSAFNIPCSVCTALVGDIETQGEAHCVDLVKAACTKFGWKCNDLIVTLACGLVKDLLQNETPDKICNNFVHCTPGAAVAKTAVHSAVVKQMQSTFNVPCSVCTSLVGDIETQGEAHCVDLINAACTKFGWKCNDLIVTAACGIVKTLLANETPDKICNNYVHCTPGARVAALSAPQTPVHEAAFKQLQAAFAIPCPICVSTIAAIEQQGEAHCADVFNAACNTLKVTCTPTVVSFACSVVAGLLKVETPDKICNFFKCTPAVANL